MPGLGGADSSDSDERPEEKSAFSRTGLGPHTFEHLSDLNVVDARLSADTERQVAGTQCVALDTRSSGAWLHVPFDEPVDFRNARVACHMAREGSAAGTYPYLDLTDVDGNRFRLRTVFRSRNRLVRLDFGVYNPQVDDTPVDLSRISRVSFRPNPTNTPGEEIVYLDYPEKVPTPETAKVVFQFDDGDVTDYTDGLPVLSRYDYPAITYVNTERVGTDGRLREDHLHELKDEGWLVGSHTTDHTKLTALRALETVEQKVRGAKQWLETRGFTEGARHFAYPYNATNERVMSVVAKHHYTARVSNWQPVALPSNLQLIPGEGDPNPETARALLDLAIQYGGVVCFYFHGLWKQEERENFRATVDAVRRREKAGDVEVVRLDELESLVLNQIEQHRERGRVLGQ